MRNFLFCSIAGVLLFSCSNNNDKQKIAVAQESISLPDWPTDSLIKGNKCASDTNYSFSLYLPSNYTKESAFPLVLVFDPQGRGDYPLSLYRRIADEYGFVLMASENARNGISLAEIRHIISILYQDAFKSVNINNQAIFAMGFSGGARTAGLMSQNFNVNAVIACGAGFETPNRKLENYMIGIVGDEDFNLMELFALNYYNPENANLIIFDGKHEWPSESTMKFAFANLDNIFVNNLDTAKFVSKIKKNYDYVKTVVEQSFLKSNPVNKYLILRLLDRSFYNDNYALWFEKNLKCTKEEIDSNFTLLQKSFSTEMQMQQVFAEAFSTQDIKWWRTNVDELERSLLNQKDPITIKLNKRLKSYLGILAFSYCSKAIASRETDVLEKFIDIYEMLEPKNPDVYFYKAQYELMLGKSDLARISINKSIELGLDKNKLKQFPELKTLVK